MGKTMLPVKKSCNLPVYILNPIHSQKPLNSFCLTEELGGSCYFSTNIQSGDAVNSPAPITFVTLYKTFHI